MINRVLLFSDKNSGIVARRAFVAACYCIITCLLLLSNARASDSYTVTVNPSFGGGVDCATCGSATLTVQAGNTASVNLVPYAEYAIGVVGGSCPAGQLVGGGTYTTGNIAADCTVLVAYQRTALENGTITLNTVQFDALTAVHASPFWTFDVGPGEAILGSVTLTTNNIRDSGDRVPFGATWTWGDRITDWGELASNLSSGSSFHDVSVDLTAPNTPGTYYIHFGFSGEQTIQQVLSASNWEASLTWNDGNDVHDFDDRDVLFNQANGFVPNWPYLFPGGYEVLDVAATSIRLFVTEGSGFTVSASAGAGGSISPSGNQSVVAGNALSFTLTPDSGYQIGTVGGTCSAGSVSGSTYTTGAITSDCSVTVNFELIPAIVYTVSASAGAGGSISPSGNQSVVAGNALSFTLTPDSGYQIGTVGGTCSAGSVSGSTYTTGAITSDCSVTVNFELIPAIVYTVSASAGAGGSISPSGNQSVVAGNALSFTLTPDSGYQIGTVGGTCSAGSVSGSTYTTGAITNDCSVTASFDPVYTVSASAGAGGSISPSGNQSVVAGNALSFTLTPDSGYQIGTVGGTCSAGLVSGSTYTTGAITGGCSVTASFDPVYTVSASAGTGGSISPSGNQTVVSGGALSFTLTPDNGYQVGTVGGTCSAGSVSGSTYTTGAITSDCSVTASFALITNPLPDAPILSVSDFSAANITLNVTPLGEGDSAIESVTAMCTLDDFEDRQSGAAYMIDRASGAFTASALKAPESLAVTDPQITQALARSYAESSKAVQLVLFDSELGEIRLNMSSYSPFAPTATIFIDEAADGSQSLNHRRYFRGAVEGFAGSYAFLSLLPSGDFDISYEVASSSRQGRMRSGAFSLADPVAAARKMPSALNLDDAVIPEELIIPADAERAVVPASTTSFVESGSFVLSGSGYSAVYAIEVPAGQRHVGVMSRGPGNAGVVMAKDATTVSAIREAAQGICRFGSTVRGVCVLEDPEPGIYYFYVYQFDSDPTEISVGFADEVKSYEGFKAPIVIDMDADLYSSFASTDEAVAYLASLFAYSSEVYEREVNTQLQIGFVQFRTQDITSSLDSIGSYWNANYPELERALVAHLTFGYSGGRGYMGPDVLCDRDYGYSTSGVDGIAPTLGAPISWDATVFSHELGHNFNSPHTHEAGGLLDNASVVDRCTSGYLPGVNSLTGGSSGGYNGTIMSYCHLLSGSMSNIASSFGQNHPYGVAADRIPQNMLSTVTNQAAIAPSCIATYIKQREWSRVVDTDGVSGDGTFDVALEDLAPQQTYTCRAIVTNASGDSPPSNTVVVQAVDIYTVTASASAGGSISPSGNQSVVAGNALSFTLTPDSGYQIGTVGGSCTAGSVSGSTYTTGAITSDCSVTASFVSLPDAPILSVSDFSAANITLNVTPLGEGDSAIESVTAMCTLDDFEDRQSGAAYMIDRASGAFTASALKAPESLAVTDPQITQALARSYAESSKAVQLVLFDSELGEIRLNMSSYSPFAPTATIFIDEAADGSQSLNHRRYFRGAVEGFAGSYAFLSLLPSGDFDISYEVASSSRQGRMRSGAFSLADPVAAARKMPSALNLDDAVIPEELIIPADAERAVVPASTTSFVESGSFVLSGSGYSAVYAIEVPAGQRHVGVMSRGPGNAGVVMAKDATTVSAIREAAQGICHFGYVTRVCVLEDPEPGIYYFYVYHFDSDPTEISVGFADEVKSYEGFKAPIVIDMDADLYSSFASTDEAVAYLASLFAYSSEVYEREVNTQLQIGFVQFRTQDITSSLSSIGSYWNANYPELERALVAHLTLGYSGGIGWVSNVSLCGREYGYSISGVDGIAPTLGAPISWDATVFSHELGHNFNSPHTHEAGGLLDNASVVDRCTSGYLPGVNSLTGGSSGGYNGTIMSYCHLLSGSMSNIASSFGQNHPYGVAADRIPQNMLSTVTNQAAIAPSCIATYIKQREWSRVVDTDGVSGDGTFDVALEDLAPQQTYTCRAIVTNASGDSPPSNTVLVQAVDTYTITASAGAGGSISPSGNQPVVALAEVSFQLTPDRSFQIGAVTGNCPEGILSANVYTTGPIEADCSVIVDFIPPSAVPSKPQILRTDVESEAVVIFVSDMFSATSYTATCTDGFETFTGTSASSTIMVPGLKNDVAYTCVVTASNGAGKSAASAPTVPLMPEAVATGLPIWLLYEATQ